MFGSKMLEQQNGQMVIQDSKVIENIKLFRLFLHYLYCDREAFKSAGTFNFKEAVFLLELGDFYALESDRFKYFVELKSQVTIDKQNALDLLISG